MAYAALYLASDEAAFVTGAVFVVELANGWVGYVPTAEAFVPERGGYEVQFLNSSKLREDTGETIVAELMDMERRLSR